MEDKAKSAVPKVHEAAEHARSAAVERIDSVRDQAESVKAKTAERVRKLGGAVRRVGEHMRVEEQFYIADKASSASERLESVASYIEDAEISTLVRDAENVARQKPLWVFGGTLLLGLAAGRVLKTPLDGGLPRSSSPEPRRLPADGSATTTTQARAKPIEASR